MIGDQKLILPGRGGQGRSEGKRRLKELGGTGRGVASQREGTKEELPDEGLGLAPGHTGRLFSPPWKCAGSVISAALQPNSLTPNRAPGQSQHLPGPRVSILGLVPHHHHCTRLGSFPLSRAPADAHLLLMGTQRPVAGPDNAPGSRGGK